MFWADKLLENRKGTEWVNDAWTPSGIVHMGGLKGPVIHDVLFKILKEQGKKVKYTFGFDDMDPIDGLPSDLQKSHEKYMGVPIFNSPAPSGEGSFGDYYGKQMTDLFKALDIQAEIYLASDYYKKGIYNKAIEFVLNNADKVRKVYSDMYKKPIAQDWFPLQVICPNCGKLGTTKVTKWDGKEVSFVCKIDLVKWAKGCGHSGRISPYNGFSKMPFKVEWAAKWWTFDVTIEGAGKDHASAGGTYDVARKICKDVFGKEPPLALPYEFFLYDGKKMSSSKGLGLTGQDLLEVLPPQIVRFLMIKTSPNQAVEFNPNKTLIIPKLYDDYQKAAIDYQNDPNSDSGRAFSLSQVGKLKYPPSLRFQNLTQWVQMPNMEAEIKKEKLQEWIPYAKIWIEKYAPEDVKFEIQKNIPKEVEKLNKEQKEFLKKVADELNNKLDAEEFQKKLYEWAKELGISSNEAFQALYVSLIGKDHGPKAAWLILEDREFSKKRFKETAEIKNVNIEKPSKWTSFSNPKIFYIDKTLANRYPSISIGVAVIKGVNINKSDPKLEKEKEEALGSLADLTTEQINQFSEVISYRKLYKETGVDWHSRRPSPEALLRRIALKKGLYSVNTCVDAYNLVVIKNRISAGAFDFDKIEFPTILKLAKNGDTIHLLGDETETSYKEGEIAYFDKAGGINLDFNYRDSVRTAVQLSTKNLYINVDGIFDISVLEVEKTLKEVCDKIMKYCGGTLEEFGVAIAS